MYSSHIYMTIILCLLLNTDFITEASHIADIFRFPCVILDLVTQMRNMDHDCILIVFIKRPVDCSAQIRLRKNLSRMSHQKSEDLEFIDGKVNSLPVL